ncbi:F0F1 ATP synthase subunit B [Fervidicella metallireducens AeB]|uniref:ATP synthase subunit b n=1 Tax=Fervidicella metallireducens AeB TaxID=1403537 RepID=A0A017RZ07_9CLOT|nr:F0F1 ATP synthase subunit B [Fervidicella metallireducens]EYE89826.1 F0F1 ATP synthase subunit B [Fervidicella metallireducens AeB]
MEISIPVIVVTIMNTLVLYFFLKKKFFVPVTDFMNERKNKIENDINNAQLQLAESEKLKKEYKEKLMNADDEGKKIIHSHKLKAEEISEDIILKAKKEAELIIERAKIDSEREKERAKDEIKNEIINLSIMTASKLINEELDLNKHHELIKDFIEKVGV